MATIARLFGTTVNNIPLCSIIRAPAFCVRHICLPTVGKLLPLFPEIQPRILYARPAHKWKNCWKNGRCISSGHNNSEAKHMKSFATYVLACFLFMLGGAYAGVPLYRMICQV